MLETENGIIIRRIQENDNVVITLLDAKGATVQIRIHGLAKSKKRSRIMSEPGCHVQATYYRQASGPASMREIEILHRFDRAKEGFQSLQLLAYFLSLTELVSIGSDTEFLFPLLKGTLERLEEKIPLPDSCNSKFEPTISLIVFFKARVIRGLGLVSSADQCSSCGNPLTGENRHLSRESGFLCSDCSSENTGDTAESEIIHIATRTRFSQFIQFLCNSNIDNTTLKGSNTLLDFILDDYLNQRPLEYQSIYSLYHLD